MPQPPFRTENQMYQPLQAVAQRVALRRGETWLLLDEHVGHGRIPDLFLGRVDITALRRRLASGCSRSLGETELRAVRALRHDRGESIDLLTARMGVSREHAREVLRVLVRDGFAKRTDSGMYRRRIPLFPILNRIVTFEAKRSDWRSALLQARAHQAYASSAYVVFDFAFAARFERTCEMYRSLGIGLIAMAPDASYSVMTPARRSQLWNPLAFALASEMALQRLVGRVVKPLVQTRLPSGSGANGYQAAPQILGPRARTLQRLVGASESRLEAQSRPAHSPAHSTTKGSADQYV